jgi:hypothetical protein
MSRYSTTMMSTVSVAARPGVDREPLVSSFIVSVTSQPQKMKMESESPAANELNDSTANGLNQSRLIGTGSNAEPLVTWKNATMPNNSSTMSWKPTRTYCTF